MSKKVKWITQTAIMTALLIVLQAVTKAFGQFVTGSCVNFILTQTVLLCGISSAIAAALLSPVFAFLLGIGPAFLPIVPGIMAGNIVLVLLLWLLTKKASLSCTAAEKLLAIGVSAFCKFACLFVIVSKLIVPLLSLNAKQSAAITAAFSWPQLVTALMGEGLAVLIWPRLKKMI